MNTEADILIRIDMYYKENDNFKLSNIRIYPSLRSEGKTNGLCSKWNTQCPYLISKNGTCALTYENLSDLLNTWTLVD